MTLRYWAQGVAQGQIAAQVWFIEIWRTPAPVIFGKSRDVLPAERVGQQAGLHRAVTDDPGAMPGAPGDFTGGGSARNQRKRRLQRIDMPREPPQGSELPAPLFPEQLPKGAEYGDRGPCWFRRGGVADR